jgi:hypothetical protein
MQFNTTLGSAEMLELLWRINLIAEETPWAKKLKHVSENKISNGERVGAGRIDDLDAALATGGDIDVFQPHAAAPDDAELEGEELEVEIDAEEAASEELAENEQD